MTPPAARRVHLVQCGDDSEFLHEMLEELQKETVDNLTQIENFLGANDPRVRRALIFVAACEYPTERVLSATGRLEVRARDQGRLCKFDGEPPVESRERPRDGEQDFRLDIEHKRDALFENHCLGETGHGTFDEDNVGTR